MNNKEFDIEEHRNISNHVDYFNKEFVTIISKKIPVIAKLNELRIKKLTEYYITLIEQDYQSLLRKEWFSQSKNSIDTSTDLIRDKYVNFCMNNIDNLDDSNAKIIIDIIDSELKDIDAKLSLHLKLDSNE